MKLLVKLLALVLLAFPAVSNAEEIDLYNLKGEAVVYIDTDKELAIYTWDGEAVSYLVDDCGPKCFYIYSWEGNHLGFFENGIV
ncbi:hypothetical protein GTO27_00055, partial [Candidatus Bathyarchaeota archaeon]|nr:hypothetical protein [Candidatus Bathyarchaeota archaeon]